MTTGSSGARPARSDSRNARQRASRASASATASSAARPRPAVSGTGMRPRAQLALLPAAEHQRLQRRTPPVAPPHDERADALRPVDLVRAHADEIDARMAERLDLPGKALRGIDVQVGVSVPSSRSATSATGWMTPVSLLTCIMLTSSVSGRSAAEHRRRDRRRLPGPEGRA